MKATDVFHQATFTEVLPYLKSFGMAPLQFAANDSLCPITTSEHYHLLCRQPKAVTCRGPGQGSLAWEHAAGDRVSSSISVSSRRTEAGPIRLTLELPSGTNVLSVVKLQVLPRVLLFMFF